MTLHIKLRHLTAGIVVVALLAGGGYAFATTRDRVIRVCANGRTRALTLLPANGRCGKGSTALAWNQQGPKGATGAKGARGSSGSTGTPATVSIGAVSTGAAGSQANVTNVGSASDAKLDFTIPQGQAGTNGTDGTNTGPTAYGQIWMGSSSAKAGDWSGREHRRGLGWRRRRQRRSRRLHCGNALPSQSSPSPLTKTPQTTSAAQTTRPALPSPT